MTKVISTHSFRGGTGKSNITANIAVLLAQQGKQVGIVDGDIQSPGIHIIFGLTEDDYQATLNDYLWGQATITQAVYPVFSDQTSGGKVCLVPSSIKPNDIARILRDGYDANDLHRGFRELIATYSLDYLLIDTHPGLNEETLLSIAVSDVLLIIMRPDQQDFQGTSVTVEIARRLRVPSINLVVNKVPQSYNMDDVRRKVEQNYKCPVIALMPLSSDIAHNASQQIFVLNEPDHSFSDGIKNIVAQLPV